MKCPLCNTELYSWTGNLISCRGTPTSSHHKFYIKWNDNPATDDGNRRVLKLAVPVEGTPVGTNWPLPNDAIFAPK